MIRSLTRAAIYYSMAAATAKTTVAPAARPPDVANAEGAAREGFRAAACAVQNAVSMAMQVRSPIGVPLRNIPTVAVVVHSPLAPSEVVTVYFVVDEHKETIAHTKPEGSE